jgi:GAF domain-containing protein/HAMP domain-containing protein
MNDPITQPVPQRDNRKRNALAICLITGILFMLVSVIIGPIAYRENGLAGLWGVFLTLTVSLSGFIGAFYVSANRVTLGVGILLTTILIMSLALPVVAHGQGLALGLMVFILVAGISSTTLSPQQATRAIISAFIIAVLITLTDQFLPEFGLPTDPRYTNWVALIASVIYAIIILWNINKYTFRTKIIVAVTLFTVVPLIALGYLNNRATVKALEAQSRTLLSTLAGESSGVIDDFITAQLNTTLSDSKQFSLIQFMELPAFARRGSGEEENARLTLLSLTRKNPVFINSIGLLDTHGNNILDTREDNIGNNESGFSYFNRPVQNRLPYASNIIFNDDGSSGIYLSAPIINTQSNAIVGLLRIEYHATILQSIIREIDTGSKDTYISIIDQNTYLQVANSGDRNELFTSINDFTDQELGTFQAINLLPPNAGEVTTTKDDASLVAGMNNLNQQPYFTNYSAYLGTNTINTGKYLETQPWVSLVSQSTDVYLAPVNAQNRTTILISLAFIVVSITAGYFASQILTSPLLSLSKVAEKIAVGDRSARAVVTTEDEIGTLATSFNRMTDELNQTLNNLEVRVAERTTDLEIARQESEIRAAELQSISEISSVITGEQKLESLLPLISNLVSERFGYYHTGIFLVDEAKQVAILQAANSEGGKKMLARGHRLAVGESGIVGYVAKFGTPRISLDVGSDAVFFNNPDLPNTRSEMALPLKVRDQIVGVLDVQSEKPGAFTENDANTLSILADQIAIALENARLFTQTQQALNEAQALNRQNSLEGWLSFSKEETSVGYYHTITGGKKLTTPIDTEEIREALGRGNVMIFDKDGKTQETSIIVPIKLRGQIIGTVYIKAPIQNRRWSNDEVNLIEAISERLSLALENARLFEEPTHRAERERLVTDITTRIRGTNDPQEMIKTAVEELKRVLGATRIEIVPQIIAPSSAE